MSDLVQNYLETAAVAGVAILIFMNLFFLIGVFLKNNSYVDIGWGLGFIVAAITTMVYNENYEFLNFLVLALITLWGTRLATHLGIRNWGKEEDFRYKNWREQWKKYFLERSYLQIYILQGIMMFLISIPTIIINTQSVKSLKIDGELGIPMYVTVILGVLVWLKGFFFELVGDFQLAGFLEEKKKHLEDKSYPSIMTTGLWKYTRHPNYFGEATLWWGFFLISINFEYGYISVISPLLIGFLLLKVSGIPMLEKKYEGNKEWEEYKKKTSAFFPLPKGVKFSLN